MNFGFDEDQESLRSLAARILDDHAAPTRLAEVERGPEPFDRDLWRAMAGSGLLAAPLAPPHGSGMGLMGAAVVLEEIGRRALLVPYWASAVVSALTIERAGSEDTAGLLAALADGTSIAVPAFEEALNFDPLHPTTQAKPGGDSWVLHGEKISVPFGTAADVFVVSAGAPDGSAMLAVVDRDSPGLTVEPAVGTAGEPQARLVLEGTPVAAGRMASGAAGPAYEIALAGLCATAAGLIDGGLRITASYIAGREQFGRPIAAFQGPAMRIADAYIDAQAVWAATWSAVWRLHTGRPASDALAIAKFWVADGGQRAVHAFQHLHGGIGVDVGYPIHRYFSQAKALEIALGGATTQLERLGASIAAESPTGPGD